MNNTVDNTAVLVENLKVHFPVHKGLLSRTVGYVKAVDDVSVAIERGDVFALVGESGCGKTTLAQTILGLTPVTSGSIKIALGNWKNSPTDWNSLAKREKRLLRRNIQMIFQDPLGSLDPRLTIRRILEEPLLIHKIPGRNQRINELLEKTGLSKSHLNRYPHEFSGGQQQRIGIARALATKPEMLIADEPVSSLDVSIRAQIINLLDDLRREYNQTLLIISHDLAVVRHMAQRMAVMYLGRIMETGTANQIYENPLHPYTRLLLDSVPVPGRGRAVRKALPSEEKNAPGLETGCMFYVRCKERRPECLENKPVLKDAGNGHMTSCFNAQKHMNTKAEQS
jgi:oligopeptide/dipeptide ABC transporter ATP-binding protein